MAEITQTLGFDVQEALTALQRLDQQLVGLEQRLQSAATAAGNFNSASKPILDAFKGIGRLAGKAAVQVSGYAQAASRAAQVAAPQAPGNMATLAAILTQAQAGLKGLVAAANQAQTAMNKLGRSAASNLNQAAKAGDKLMVTFGTLSRVVATQLVVRAMSSLRNGMEESLSAAIGFETQLAQIQTIGGPAVGTLGDVAKQVRAVSEAFNRPIEDVAQGYYNILSNQIEKAADAHLVLVESARLATVAVSSLDDATNALSSVINSYGMNASDAADISGKLFAAVDKGRFTLSEIANTIGRTTTLAHEMGVSFEEVLASLATLTISGIKADEAQTLLSNAMRGLLKPTKAMKAAFAELNVANAEVGVATYGFQGFLERLRDTTDGTASEVTQLTENIRVGRGVFGLTGKAAEKYRKTLEEIRGAGAESLQSKFQIIMNTNAQQVQNELTKLRNFFVNDFGIVMLKIIKQTVDGFGGLVNIVRSLKDAMLTVAVVVPTFIAAQAAITTALKATTALTLGLRIMIGLKVGVAALWAVVLAHPIIAVVAAVTALAAAIAWWRGRNQEAIQTSGDLIDQLTKQHEAFALNADQLAAAATAEAKKVQATRTETVDKAYQQQFRLVAELKSLYEKDRDNAIEAQKDILERLKDQLKERLSLITKLINELERKQEESTRIIEKNRKESSDLKLKDQERYLDRQLGRLNDQAKAVKQLQRARELESRAAKLSNANDFEGAEDLLKTADERANAALELNEARLKEAATTAEQQDALLAIGEAEREVNGILQQRLGLREQENKAAQAQAMAAQQEITARRTQLADAKRLIEQIDKFEVISKNKDVAFEDRDSARKAVLSLTDQLETVLSQGDLNVEQFLGIQDLARKIRAPFESALTDTPVSLHFAFDEGIDAVFSKLEGRTIKVKAVITELEQASGAKFNVKAGMDEVAVGLVNKRRELLEAVADQASLPTEEANLAKNADLIKTLSSEIGISGTQLSDNLNKMLVQAQAATYQALQGQGEWLLSLSKDLGAAADELGKKARLTVDSAVRTSLLEESTRLAQLATTMTDVVAGQQKVANLKAAAPQVEAAIQQNVDAGQNSQNIQMVVRFDEMVRSATDGQRVFLRQTDLIAPATDVAKERASSSYTAIKDAISGATAAQNALNDSIRNMPVPSTGSVQSRSLGGLMSEMRFFESGGAARGTDTIPAMLSPGEFVTSAKNTRRFLPQLQAINAGIPPIAEPSAVTYNTTVGDINVNGAQQPKLVAREVMAAIRREQRRGSGRL